MGYQRTGSQKSSSRLEFSGFKFLILFNLLFGLLISFKIDSFNLNLEVTAVLRYTKQRKNYYQFSGFSKLVKKFCLIIFEAALYFVYFQIRKTRGLEVGIEYRNVKTKADATLRVDQNQPLTDRFYSIILFVIF